MGRKVRGLLALAVVGLMIGLGEQAEASLMELDFSSFLGPTSTLDGVALGAAGTPVSFQAVFDTTAGVPHGQGAEVFPVISMTGTIAGYGTFTGVPDPNLDVVLADASYGGYGVFSAGLVDSTLIYGFVASFKVATPPFTAAAPTPTVFSDFLPNYGIFSPPLTIDLVGVPGGLVVNDFDMSASPVASASLVAVPEPSSLALAGIAAAILGLGGIVLQRRRGGITFTACVVASAMDPRRH